MRHAIIVFFLLGTTACGAAKARYTPKVVAGAADSGAAPAERIMVKRASLTIEVDDADDFERTGQAIATIAKDLKGYVVNSSHRWIELRVPAARLEAALDAISALGDVEHREVGAVDVTAQVTDLKVRIDNLKTLRIRLKALVERAEEVKDLIGLEKELARVTSELERLEAQQRGLARDVAMSQITVRLEEDVSPGPIGWVFYGLYRGVKWLLVWD
jgi:hypothetical protein